MRRLSWVLALIGSLVLTAPALAQGHDSLEALAPGRRAFSFRARALERGGETAIGLWRVVAPGRSRGFVVQLASGVVRNHYDQGLYPPLTTSMSTLALAAGPRFRRYVAATAPVAPFFETGLDAGVGYSRGTGGNGTARVWTSSLGGDVGAGAEWFPLRRVSVSAQAGLRARVAYDRVRAPAGASSSAWGGSLGTVISALTAQIYF